MAALAEIGTDDLEAFERGDGDIPHIDTLVRLAATLEADPDDLLAGIEWVPESGHWRISSR